MKKIKQVFQEKIILSAVMCVLLAMVLVTATYSWYALNNTDKAYGLDLKTGAAGGLKVAITPGGEDIMADPGLTRIEEDDKVIAIIPINLKDFINIEEDRIAPGAYGPMPFYITSMSESIRSYSIKIQLEYEPELSTATEDQKQKVKEIESMIRDHFSIYQKKYTDDDGIVRFSDPLSYYIREKDAVEAATGPLKFNEEVPVRFYWVWNYELTDIPGYRNLERFPTYGSTEGGTDDGTGEDTDENVVRKAVRQYDEEDTELGNYLEDIRFNVYIEGSVEGVGD